jgi:hypothetical protein
MITFSASELVKRSATQIKYLRAQAVKRKTFNKGSGTENQIKGNEFAALHTKSRYVEMQDVFCRPYGKFYYSFDEVRKVGTRFTFIEHKWFEGELPEWFEHNSAIQAAFQGSLLYANMHYSSTNSVFLQTASFSPNEEKFALPVDASCRLIFKLNINGDFKRIKFNPYPILQFYMTKARASLTHETAVKFDKSYKHKEWDSLKDHIQVSKR